MKDVMTSKQRILAAIQRKPIDRFPTQIDFSPQMLDIMCKAYSLPLEGEEALLPFIDNHIVYGFINDTYGALRKRKVGSERIAYDNFGVGWDMYQEGIFPAVHPLENEDAYCKYEWPDPHFPKLMDLVEASVSKWSEKYIVSSYQVTLLFERAYALRGYENFLMDLIVNEDLAEDILEKITKYQIEIAKRCVMCGVSCGRTGDDYGIQQGMLFSPDMWRRVFKPKLKRIVEIYKESGLPVIHHSCGNVLAIIPDLIEIGIDVLNNVQPEAMERKELAKFAEQISFYGGISTQNVLPIGTKDEIYYEVQNCMDTLGKVGGYILSPGISIVSDVPMQNIKNLLSALNDLNGCHNIFPND